MRLSLPPPNRISPWFIRFSTVPTIKARKKERFGTPSDTQQRQISNSRKWITRTYERSSRRPKKELCYRPAPRLARGLSASRLRFQPLRISCAAYLASRAAFRFPSPAETIDPFINICQTCANFSGSCKFASSARPRTIARIFARWMAAAWRTSC